MSLLKALSIQEHSYWQTGDYVFIGSVNTPKEAIQLHNIEESYMMKRMYRGLLVDAFLANYNPTTTALGTMIGS